MNDERFCFDFTALMIFTIRCKRFAFSSRQDTIDLVLNLVSVVVVAVAIDDIFAHLRHLVVYVGDSIYGGTGYNHLFETVRSISLLK